jgi:hypothetical protein
MWGWEYDGLWRIREELIVAYLRHRDSIRPLRLWNERKRKGFLSGCYSSRGFLNIRVKAAQAVHLTCRSALCAGSTPYVRSYEIVVLCLIPAGCCAEHVKVRNWLCGCFGVLIRFKLHTFDRDPDKIWMIKEMGILNYSFLLNFSQRKTRQRPVYESVSYNFRTVLFHRIWETFSAGGPLETMEKFLPCWNWVMKIRILVRRRMSSFSQHLPCSDIFVPFARFLVCRQYIMLNTLLFRNSQLILTLFSEIFQTGCGAHQAFRYFLCGKAAGAWS